MEWLDLLAVQGTLKSLLQHHSSKASILLHYDFSSSHVWMRELDCEESWAPKNWCFWTVVLEKTLESPLDCKEIQPLHRKGHQSWVLIGRTNVEAETLILWPPDVKSWLTGKDPDAGKDWGQEKVTTEDEMVGWHHWHNGHGLGALWGLVMDREPGVLGSQRVRHWGTELNWTVQDGHLWKNVWDALSPSFICVHLYLPSIVVYCVLKFAPSLLFHSCF